MENQANTQGFNYTYSAKEQDEVRRIREKYVTGEEFRDQVKWLKETGKIA